MNGYIYKNQNFDNIQSHNPPGRTIPSTNNSDNAVDKTTTKYSIIVVTFLFRLDVVFLISLNDVLAIPVNFPQ